MDSLDNMGYTYLYAEKIETVISLYEMFPSLVKVIVMEEGDIEACLETHACIKSPSNVYGIPIWKIFTWLFWAVGVQSSFDGVPIMSLTDDNSA
jgi:hypothetical protein